MGLTIKHLIIFCIILSPLRQYVPNLSDTDKVGVDLLSNFIFICFFSLLGVPNSRYSIRYPHRPSFDLLNIVLHTFNQKISKSSIQITIPRVVIKLVGLSLRPTEMPATKKATESNVKQNHSLSLCGS